MAWLNNVFNFLAGGQYTQAPVAVTTGTTAPLLIDAYGRLVTVSVGAGTPVATGGSSFYDTTVLAPSGVIKASSGSLYLVVGANESANKRWLMLFNATSLPVNGTAPVYQFPVPTLAPFSLDLPRGRTFSTGIVWAASSTAATLTVDVATPFWLNAEYV